MNDNHKHRCREPITAPFSNKIPSWILWRSHLATGAVTPGKGHETHHFYTPESVRLVKFNTRNDFMLLLWFIQDKGGSEGNVNYDKWYLILHVCWFLLMFELSSLQTLTEMPQGKSMKHSDISSHFFKTYCISQSFGLVVIGANVRSEWMAEFYGRRLTLFWEGGATEQCNITRQLQPLCPVEIMKEILPLQDMMSESTG